MTSLLDFTAAQDFSALIFDCDGTLADTAEAHFRAFDKAFADQGLRMTKAWYFDRLGISRHQLYDQFETEFGVRIDRESLSDTSETLFHDHVAAVREVTEVAEVARHYRGRVPMAVASGGQGVLVRATLQSIDLIDLFDQIVTVEAVAHGKPAPDLFLLAAARLGAKPDECLVFEDSDEGLEAARRAGMAAKDVRGVKSSAA